MHSTAHNLCGFSRLKRVAVLLAAWALLLAGCNDAGKSDKGGSAQGDGAGPIKAVCTIGMITDVARTIGGAHVDVEGLMGPGVDPHLYQAKASDLSKLQDADVIFFNGLHLEAKLGDLLVKMAADVKTVQVTSAIPEPALQSPPEFQGQHDPHVWMDVALWKTIVNVVRDTYIELDPAHAEDFTTNAAAYLAELDKLDAYVKQRAAELDEKQRVLITAHDAFNYFGRAYGFTVRGLQGISTQAEAGTDDVQALVSYVVDNKIPAIFVESSVPRRNVEAVQAAARSRGWEVAIGGELYSDAMGDAASEDGTYIGMIRHNIDTIVDALKP